MFLGEFILLLVFPAFYVLIIAIDKAEKLH